MTFTVALPPALPIETDEVESVYGHGAAACETLTVVPATVTVAERALAAALAAADNVTVPDPDPPVAESVTHGAAEDAVHVHPVGAVMARLVLPPPLANEVVVGETV